ncbi:bacteriophage Gp15 family protein [Faecalicatena sp. BF-R-105]|nr:bacteriophage Gp15 family protein [Faecalicatena sp. BF-R-105]
MNPLYEPLPKSVEVGGVLYPVKTDFRAVLKLIGEVKQAGEPGSRLFLILRLYKKEIPPDIQGAVQAVTDFIAGIRSAEKEKEREGSGKQTFSYEKDAPYIVSDFWNYYGIDLLACKYLHWQKFQMLLEGLPDDSGTKTRIGYRSIDAGKIRDKQERRRIQKIQRAISLEDERDEEQIGDLFAAAMWED